MGDTIWVDMQGRGKDELPSDNSIMLCLKDELDRLSDKLRVSKLSQFYDYSELEAQYSDFAEDSDLSEVPTGASHEELVDGVWFDPSLALVAVKVIHDHLLQHPENLGFVPDKRSRHWPDNLMKELEASQKVLEGAISKGRKIRFLIVP